MPPTFRLGTGSVFILLAFSLARLMSCRPCHGYELRMLSFESLRAIMQLADALALENHDQIATILQVGSRLKSLTGCHVSGKHELVIGAMLTGTRFDANE